MSRWVFAVSAPDDFEEGHRVGDGRFCIEDDQTPSPLCGGKGMAVLRGMTHQDVLDLGLLLMGVLDDWGKWAEADQRGKTWTAGEEVDAALSSLRTLRTLELRKLYAQTKPLRKALAKMRAEAGLGEEEP